MPVGKKHNFIISTLRYQSVRLCQSKSPVQTEYTPPALWYTKSQPFAMHSPIPIPVSRLNVPRHSLNPRPIHDHGKTWKQIKKNTIKKSCTKTKDIKASSVERPFIKLKQGMKKYQRWSFLIRTNPCQLGMPWSTSIWRRLCRLSRSWMRRTNLSRCYFAPTRQA